VAEFWPDGIAANARPNRPFYTAALAMFGNGGAINPSYLAHDKLTRFMLRSAFPIRQTVRYAGAHNALTIHVERTHDRSSFRPTRAEGGGPCSRSLCHSTSTQCDRVFARVKGGGMAMCECATRRYRREQPVAATIEGTDQWSAHGHHQHQAARSGPDQSY